MTIEAPESAVPELEHKAAPSTVQALEVKPEGLVTAVVSVTGVVDEVNDLLEGGCYSDTLGKRKPKVIRNHDWNQQVGRVVAIEEYLPGDSRLPKETKDGQPWPAAAGALVATMQYNLGTDRGRNAFQDIKFYSDSGEAEFSIGYRVPPGGARRRPDGVRQVKKLDLWEISDVLFGAAPLTMALSLKDAQAPGETAPADPAPEQPAEPAAPTEPAPTEPAQPDEPAPAQPPAVEPDPAEPQLPAAPVSAENTEPAPEPAAAEPTPEPAPPAEPEPATPPAQPAEPAPEVAPAAVPTATIPTEPAPADPVPTDPAPTEPEPADPVEPALTDEQVAELHAAAIAEIDWDEIAAAAAETAAQLRAAAATEPQATDDGQADGEVLTAAEVAEGLALLAEAGVEVKRKFSTAERDKAAGKGQAMESGSFPIKNMADLKNAIKAVGRAKNPEAAKKHIIARAKALNLSWALPKDWQERKTGESLEQWADRNAAAIAELEVKAEGGADRNRGQAEKLRRWYTHGEGAAKIRWGQPGDFDRCVRIAQKHMRPDQAKGYCNLRHHDALGYYPATHAARVAAAKGRKSAEFAGEVTLPAGMGTISYAAAVGDDGKLTLWTPAAEVGPHAGHLQAKATKKAERALAGSLEERREAVRSAVSAALVGPADADGKFAWDRVSLLGTWDDKVVARREAWGQEGRTSAEVFEVGYGFDSVGRIVLGTPVPVELDVDVLPTIDATVYSGVADATAAVKTLMAFRPLEVKEGRVLSGSNLARLRDAVTALLAVLAAAGVPIDDPSAKQIEDEKLQGRAPEPMVAPDTTSDGARNEGYARKTAVISPEELAEGLALLV